ncbi:hypothetical protein QFW80_16590 [Luteimonas sp. M1R5S18]|uniref:Uncharacterized protein n=1 Tax=Luteimonas rhizosphaericola TaxID=3042024 RepID=A0ABT6JNP5_9GAMM|nr:hypothetical protein [Luteimonas rhizosphaericola]MDH5832137.1 hypothetical protein [Luteimonas rhizosphaericola]
MNELRELVGLVKDLPNAALWVIAAIFLSITPDQRSDKLFVAARRTQRLKCAR